MFIKFLCLIFNILISKNFKYFLLFIVKIVFVRFFLKYLGKLRFIEMNMNS